MKIAVLTMQEIASWFKMVPVEGEPGEYVIHSNGPTGSTDKEMTDEDWDKFEKDIHDAFERVDDDRVQIP